MKIYLNNLLSRLSEFSSTLDKKENFVDIPWVIVSEEKAHQKIIFKRDGNLILSLNGKVTMGKWEYLPYAKSLLLDRIQDKILLNQDFINPAVMALKFDGKSNDHMILANEIIIPDLNVIAYLKELYYRQYGVGTFELRNGKLLEVKFSSTQTCDNEVTIDCEPVPDGTFEVLDEQKKYIIKNSRIARTLVKEVFKTNHGEVEIEHQEWRVPSYGDLVYKNGLPAPDGKYRFGFFDSFYVQNGRISV